MALVLLFSVVIMAMIVTFMVQMVFVVGDRHGLVVTRDGVLDIHE